MERESNTRTFKVILEQNNFGNVSRHKWTNNHFFGDDPS